jgi:hypothetical protein
MFFMRLLYKDLEGKIVDDFLKVMHCLFSLLGQNL